MCWDRRRDIYYDENAIAKKYGVSPASIPDYLALVGDSADGIPGIPAWGAKSAAVILSRYQHIEDIPDDIEGLGFSKGRARRLLENLTTYWEDALLYRRLTILRNDVPIEENINDLEWRGAQGSLKNLCLDIGSEELLGHIPKWA